MKRTFYEVPEFNLLKLCDKMHLTGENAFETARRVLVHGALARCYGCQEEAATLLGLTKRQMNYACADLRLRPVDRGEYGR